MVTLAQRALDLARNETLNELRAKVSDIDG
jgi:hypothetical protein